MFDFFQAFLKKMAANFQSIAKAAKCAITVDDLKQDAWIIALELGEERGREVDFSDPDDQEQVMRRVNFRNVARGDWKLRNAVRIDRQPDDDENSLRWADRLAASPASDPVTMLIMCESARNLEEMLSNSFSQAVAYLTAFSNLKNDRKRICEHLAISGGTLNRRIKDAVAVFKMQPSLFDGIESIKDNFLPLKGRSYAVRKSENASNVQEDWLA